MEKEVFDLDSYNYNRTLVTSNVDTSFLSVMASSSGREDLTTILETIRRNFVGNTYHLDQIERIKIWEHTKIKLKPQLK